MKLKNKWVPNLEITLDKLNQNSALKGQEPRWLGTVWGPSGLVIETLTGTATLANNEQDIVLINAASAATITLSFNASTRVRPLIFKKIGNGNVTILPNGTDLIDGGANIQLRGKDAVTLIPNGGNWWLI